MALSDGSDGWLWLVCMLLVVAAIKQPLRTLYRAAVHLGAPSHGEQQLAEKAFVLVGAAVLLLGLPLGRPGKHGPEYVADLAAVDVASIAGASSAVPAVGSSTPPVLPEVVGWIGNPSVAASADGGVLAVAFEARRASNDFGGSSNPDLEVLEYTEIRVVSSADWRIGQPGKPPKVRREAWRGHSMVAVAGGGGDDSRVPTRPVLQSRGTTAPGSVGFWLFYALGVMPGERYNATEGACGGGSVAARWSDDRGASWEFNRLLVEPLADPTTGAVLAGRWPTGGLLRWGERAWALPVATRACGPASAARAAQLGLAGQLGAAVLVSRDNGLSWALGETVRFPQSQGAGVFDPEAGNGDTGHAGVLLYARGDDALSHRATAAAAATDGGAVEGMGAFDPAAAPLWMLLASGRGDSDRAYRALSADGGVTWGVARAEDALPLAPGALRVPIAGRTTLDGEAQVIAALRPDDGGDELRFITAADSTESPWRWFPHGTVRREALSPVVVAPPSLSVTTADDFCVAAYAVDGSVLRVAAVAYARR